MKIFIVIYNFYSVLVYWITPNIHGTVIFIENASSLLKTLSNILSETLS